MLMVEGVARLRKDGRGIFTVICRAGGRVGGVSLI